MTEFIHPSETSIYSPFAAGATSLSAVLPCLCDPIWQPALPLLSEKREKKNNIRGFLYCVSRWKKVKYHKEKDENDHILLHLGFGLLPLINNLSRAKADYLIDMTCLLGQSSGFLTLDGRHPNCTTTLKLCLVLTQLNRVLVRRIFFF